MLKHSLINKRRMSFSARRKMILIAFISFTADIHVTSGSSRFFPRPYAENVIRAICPVSNICDVKSKNLKHPDPCCTECYCGDECVDNRECCFRENNKTEFETCLYLRSNANNVYGFTRVERTQFSYYVVTKTPKDGCHENYGSCDPSDTSTIYPVFSETTKRIYFNKDCAICHGVSDVLEPEYYFFCDEISISQPLNFEVELSKFLEGDKSSLCFLVYSFSSDAIENRKCSIHSIDSIESLVNITDRDKILSNYNMSVEDVADACVTSFFSPTFSSSTNRWYPNPFCYLYGEGTHKKDICFRENGNPSGVKLLALLNPKVEAILPLKAKRRTRNMDQVCLKSTTSRSYSQHDGCRPVSCPIGHIFDEEDGCLFFGSRIFNDGRMNIWVNLILRSLLDIYMNEHDLINLDIDYLAKTLLLSHDWEIAFWGLSTDSPQNGQQEKKDIIVMLKVNTYDLALAIDALKDDIDNVVVIKNVTYTLSIYGKTLTLENILPEDVLAVTQCSPTKNIAEIDLIKDDIPECWNMVGYGVPQYQTITTESIAKLYFCEVVSLLTGEYRLLANDTLLFNEINGKYLHKNEFLVQKDENNIESVKVCLEDSGLIRFKASASNKDKDAGYVYIVFIGIYSMYLTPCA